MHIGTDTFQAFPAYGTVGTEDQTLVNTQTIAKPVGFRQLWGRWIVNAGFLRIDQTNPGIIKGYITVNNQDFFQYHHITNIGEQIYCPRPLIVKAGLDLVMKLYLTTATAGIIVRAQVRYTTDF